MEFNYYLKILHVLITGMFIKRRVIKKQKVKVCFFVIHRSVWKLDNLYKLMEKDERYDPVIVVCPYTVGSETEQKEELSLTFDFFKARNYNVISSYDENNGWLDVNHIINPDVVFFTNPHNITLPQYRWSNFRDRLTCYVPYHHQIDSGQWKSQWNSPFHLSMWRLFYINSFHKQLAKIKMANMGRNVWITGYPGTESFYINNIDNKTTSISPWKPSTGKKKIIWAPHHTIVYDPILGVSTFLEISDLMVEISKKFSEKVMFAFKPHPILKNKLYNHPDWGKEKTDNYYKYWSEANNCQLEEGDYIELFKNSDAMIHDSGSFLAEYLYLNKPVFYFVNNSTRDRFNEFGHKCLNACFNGGVSDVEKFILDIINDDDYMQLDREKFIHDELLKDINDSYPSERIYNILSEEIFGN